MAVQSQQITLGSSSEQSIVGSALHGPIRVWVRNAGAGLAYIGASPVTTATGWQLTTADAPVQLFIMGGEQLFAYSTGTPVIHVLRTCDTT